MALAPPGNGYWKRFQQARPANGNIFFEQMIAAAYGNRAAKILAALKGRLLGKSEPIKSRHRRQRD